MNSLKLLKIWWRISVLAAETELLTNWSGVLFIIGKIIRFVFYFAFLFTVLSGINNLAGFSREQVILFFLVFNLIDIATQGLFRGVYHFRPSVVSGNFDLDLLKPWPSFFRPIFGWADVLDFITLFFLTGYFLYFIFIHHFAVSPLSLVIFILMIANSLILGLAFHLLVCSFGILTLEVDYLVWLYRDLTGMARFPTDIYPRAVQNILTFAIPVVIVFSVPTKVLLGMLSWPMIFFFFFIGFFSLVLSVFFWKYALKRYSSASS
ncbi:MAG: ABC transporter permease [Patescibacteria group bacterium]|nr:ABC transporter permease [Patescibacteria group bacterium]